MRTELDCMYGPEIAARVIGDVEDLIAEYRSRIAPRQRRVDQRTGVLIAYGDSICRDGEPPLRTLARFVRDYAGTLLDTVHVLPFYPYSSDDGFSVIDDLAVDPALGTWADIAALPARKMFDAVLNHCSARSASFRGYLDGDPARANWFIAPESDADLRDVVRPRTHPLLTRFEAHEGPRDVWTTFSADQVDRNFAEPAVLVDTLRILLEYALRGAEFLRLDAIAFLWKRSGTSCLHLPETHAAVRLIRKVLDRAAPHVALITETNVPHDEKIAYFGNGRDEVTRPFDGGRAGPRRFVDRNLRLALPSVTTGR